MVNANFENTAFPEQGSVWIDDLVNRRPAADCRMERRAGGGGEGAADPGGPHAPNGSNLMTRQASPGFAAGAFGGRIKRASARARVFTSDES